MTNNRIASIGVLLIGIGVLLSSASFSFWILGFGNQKAAVEADHAKRAAEDIVNKESLVDEKQEVDQSNSPVNNVPGNNDSASNPPVSISKPGPKITQAEQDSLRQRAKTKIQSLIDSKDTTAQEKEKLKILLNDPITFGKDRETAKTISTALDWVKKHGNPCLQVLKAYNDKDSAKLAGMLTPPNGSEKAIDRFFNRMKARFGKLEFSSKQPYEHGFYNSDSLGLDYGGGILTYQIVLNSSKFADCLLSVECPIDRAGISKIRILGR